MIDAAMQRGIRKQRLFNRSNRVIIRIRRNSEVHSPYMSVPNWKWGLRRFILVGKTN